ncbi:type III pantothenate kinase [Deferribacterales bacterium RsTz2092]|nr:type III pantothenate kinase [Deferribacterales bacterium]
MVLVVDVGNTNIVVGVMDDGHVLHQFRFLSDIQKTTDEYALSILSILERHRITTADIECVLVSSVVPPLTYTISRMVSRYFGQDAIVVNGTSDHGLTLLVTQPNALGTDRLMAAVAARKMHKTNCIIIDYGTATTIDALTDKGEFLGGIIFPGVQLSAQALHINTAQLPQVELSSTSNLIGRNTIEAIQSGLYYGYIELVDGLIDRIKREYFADKSVMVMSTGGLGNLLSQASRHNMLYDASLILYGLHFTYLRLVKNNTDVDS